MFSTDLFIAFSAEMEKLALTAEKKALHAKGLGIEVTEGDWRKAGVLAKKGKLKKDDLAHPSQTFIDRVHATAQGTTRASSERGAGIEQGEIWRKGGARHQLRGGVGAVEMPSPNRHGIGSTSPRIEQTAHDLSSRAPTARFLQHVHSDGVAPPKRDRLAQVSTVHSHPYTADARTNLPHTLSTEQALSPSGNRFSSGTTRFPGTLPSRGDVGHMTSPRYHHAFHGIYDPAEHAVSHLKLRNAGTSKGVRGLRLLSKVK